MGKVIVIQEGGIGRQITADKLKTYLVGGGSCLWVPEDETQLGTKYITENGTHRAADDGYYGYSEVTVSGIGSVTGKDPDTGEDVTVTKDPTTGEIVETVNPAEIRVTTNPSKTTYSSGETINFSGIVVHKYSSTGRDLGEVPFSELVFPVTIAGSGGEGDTYTDGSGVNAEKISYLPAPGISGIVYVSKQLGTRNGNPIALGSGGTPGQYLMTRYSGSIYAMVITGDGIVNGYQKIQVQSGDLLWSIFSSASVCKDNHFHWCGDSGSFVNLPESTKDPTGIDPSTLRANESIPVQWTPSGGSTLESSFDITLT